MSECFELVENKICTTKTNTDLMKQIFGRYADIVNIWENIGFDQETINNRLEQLQKAILSTLIEINEGEIDLFNQIKESINRYKTQVDNLKLRLKIDLSPLITKIVRHNDQNKEIKQHDESLKIDQSLVISNQTKLLEENYFYKSLYLELERIKEERKRRYLELKNKEESLTEQLDETFYSISNKSVLNESDLKRVEDHVVNLKDEKEKRINLIKKFHENIKKIGDENQIELDNKSSLFKFKYFDEECVEDFEIDSSSMDKYRKSMDKLINKRDELIESIDTIKHDISYMWERFEIKNESLLNLVENYEETEYTQQTFQILLNEYSRCVELKKFKLKDVIYELRDQIKMLWSKLVITGPDTLKFESFYNETNISEELLSKHEEYLNELKLFSEKYQTIFELIQKWVLKWADHVQFETEYSDPSRFSKRNYSALYEERQRRHFAIELARLERSLETESQAYFEKEKKQFMYAGLPILAFVKTQKEKYDLNRENSRRVRQTKKSDIHRDTLSAKISTPNKQNLVNKKITNSCLKANPKTPTITPTIRRPDNYLKKDILKSIVPKTPQIDKRKSFTKLHKIKRDSMDKIETASQSKQRSKSCLNRKTKINEVDSNENGFNLDTILGGNYKYKGRNGNISSGIESIISLSDLENPACNSSFIL